MSLNAGARIGSYEVLSAIGAGGMGEVYRARDTKLNRDVALKILPAEFVLDPDRRGRFTREAQLLAALNHPNIAAIYGVEDSGDTHALVLELVEGETLGDRIARGAIPIGEALPIARQICDALEAAHEHAIIHRDLKPANIKVRPDGTVKVLDFGLAKLSEPLAANGASVSSALSLSPTITSPALMTGVGVLLGTAAYMAPEQARGKVVDKRADIWAFGCVVYEMLTEIRAFAGDDIPDVIIASLTKEPDWTKLPTNTPVAVHRLLSRCLTKDPHKRTHDIADARLEIETAMSERAETAAPVTRWVRLGTAATLFALAAAVVGGVLDRWVLVSSGPRTTVQAPLVRASIDLPAEAPLAIGSDIALGYNSPVLAVSRDGSSLAYVAQTAKGRVLYLREMSTGEVRVLAGTEGALHPFFSPDGQWVGFLTIDHVKKVPRQGGTVISLCEADTPVLAWWRGANQIYFTETETYALSRISADGGKPERIANAQELNVVRFDDVLPDGQNVLAETGNSTSGDFGNIVRINLRSRETKLLVRSGFAARYVQPGYLLFARASNLMAVRYDPNTGESVGEPMALASGVAMESLFGMLHADSSAGGVAAYVPGADLSIGKLAWIDRRGTVDYLDVPERVYGALDLAPNGMRLAVPVADVKDYLWIWDFVRGEGRRVTNEISEGFPRWSADGRRLGGSSMREVGLVHDVLPNGTVSEGRVVEKKGQLENWTPDGNVLAVSLFPALRVEFLGIDKPVNVPAVPGFFTTFSPDGRWLAYVSTETGTGEIFIRSYPEGKVIGQVSVGGGSTEPRWKASGDLLYRTGHRWFSTRVSTTPEPRWDPPHLVFDTEFIDTPGWSYDVSRDGQRLLVVKRTHPVSASRINVIANWLAAFPELSTTH